MTIHPRGSVRRVPPYVSSILSQPPLRDVEVEALVRHGVETTVNLTAGRRRGMLHAYWKWELAFGLGREQCRRRVPVSLVQPRNHQTRVARKAGPSAAHHLDSRSFGCPSLLKQTHGNVPTPYRRSIMVVPTWTDNRGNCAARNRLMTPRFPVRVLLMELT